MEMPLVAPGMQEPLLPALNDTDHFETDIP